MKDLSDSSVRLRMNETERNISIRLALVFATRMFGLFLLMPVFAQAAAQLDGGTDKLLVGIALGAYGLTQAIMQIPLGMASDRWGRKPVVLAGLGVFVAGGIICALTDQIWLIAVGRAVQGLGAVSAALTAWVADGTRIEIRTRAMAMMGGSIGLSFALALVLAPVLVQWGGLPALFWVITLLGIACWLIVWLLVPSMPQNHDRAINGFAKIAHAPKVIWLLNGGVFCLHACMMAMFVVMPVLLINMLDIAIGQLWQVYLPVILLSFVGMVPLILLTEQRGLHFTTLRWAVLLMFLVLLALALVLLLSFGQSNAWLLVLLLVLFFVGFNLVEALQPALVSRHAATNQTGLYLGIYNMFQALGVATGGVLGGWLATKGMTNVFIGCAVLLLVWYLCACKLGTIKRSM